MTMKQPKFVKEKEDKFNNTYGSHNKPHPKSVSCLTLSFSSIPVFSVFFFHQILQLNHQFTTNMIW